MSSDHRRFGGTIVVCRINRVAAYADAIARACGGPRNQTSGLGLGIVSQQESGGIVTVHGFAEQVALHLVAPLRL